MKSLKQYITEAKVVKAININCKEQDFLQQIFSKDKTIETRETPSLNCVKGQRVALVKTGKGKAMIVGYATIGEPVEYKSVEEFDKDYKKHLVASNSPFHISKSKSGKKYGYPLTDVKELTEPIPCNSKGIVVRKVDLDEE